MRIINLLLLLVFILIGTFQFISITHAGHGNYGNNEKLFYDDDDDDDDDGGDNGAGKGVDQSKNSHYSYSNSFRYYDGSRVNISESGSTNKTSSKRYYQPKPSYMRKYGKVSSFGNRLKDNRYSETTDFNIRVGTDRYGRRKDYSQFETYGSSNGYSGNMLVNGFDIFGKGYSETRYNNKYSVKKENRREKLFTDSGHTSQSVTLNSSTPAN